MAESKAEAAGIQVKRVVGPSGIACEIIEVPNPLAAKAGQFRADRVNKGEIAARLESLAQGYPDLVRADVDQLAPLWARATAGERDEAAERDMFRIVHDISGQSETFGYPLVGHVAGSLRVLLGGDAVRRPRTHPAVVAHIQSLSAVLRRGIKGDGGAEGKEILKMLHTAVLRCLAPKTSA